MGALALLNFSLNFLAKLSMSKFFFLANTGLRALLLSGVLKTGTEFGNMTLHERIDCRAKGKLKAKNLGGN